MPPGIRYNPEAGKVLSARYKFGRNEKIYLQSDGDYFYDKLSQVDLAAQCPLKNNLYATERHILRAQRQPPARYAQSASNIKSGCGCWSASVVGGNITSPGSTAAKTPCSSACNSKILSNIGNNPSNNCAWPFRATAKPTR